jgi:hypothetical protein
MRRGDESRLPPRAIMSKARKAGAYRTCLHPAASAKTCGKIISAHTLQRARVLREIGGPDGHVLTFHPFEPQVNGGLLLHRRGWNQASTFDAFCDRHDATTFAPLETKSFTGTKEQIFLTAYRATCWELYQKTRVVRSGPALRDLLDRGTSEPSQRRVQELLAVQAAGFQKGLAELREGKQQMDRALLASDYTDFSAYEFRLEGPVPLASTGAITPNRTLTGEALQTLHISAARMQWLAFGLDVRQNGASFVFLWSRDDSAPARYIGEVAGLQREKIAEFLCQFPFAHCENTYFKEDWWQALSGPDRAFLENLMANSNPYYSPPEYQLNRRAAPWRITSHGEVNV